MGLREWRAERGGRAWRSVEGRVEQASGERRGKRTGRRGGARRGEDEIPLFAVQNHLKYKDGAASDTVARGWKRGVKRDIGGSTRGTGKTTLRGAAPQVALARRRAAAKLCVPLHGI